jgi:hypothetical protein
MASPTRHGPRAAIADNADTNGPDACVLASGTNSTSAGRSDTAAHLPRSTLRALRASSPTAMLQPEGIPCIVVDRATFPRHGVLACGASTGRRPCTVGLIDG